MKHNGTIKRVNLRKAEEVLEVLWKQKQKFFFQKMFLRLLIRKKRLKENLVQHNKEDV